MAVDDSMHRLYVLSINSKDQRQFTAIDTASWSTIKNIVFNATSNTPGPPLAVDPVSHDIFACAGTPQRISATTFTVQTYPVGPGPHALSCVATP